MNTRIMVPVILVGILLAGGAYFAIPMMSKNTYDTKTAVVASVVEEGALVETLPEASDNGGTGIDTGSEGAPSSSIAVTHIATPSSVKALYMSSWVAGTPSFRAKLVKIAEETEINTLVIDIKDATGKVSFLAHDPALTALGSTENRIGDLDEFIASLHAKGIYVIGRIAVFQDPYMTVKHPDWAITKKSDGAIWKDFKGLSFLDPSNSDVRKYIVSIAKESYAHGFDEINFDYVRFPSDGKISDIAYPNVNGTTTRADIIESFFKELHESLAGTGIITSADLFGLVTTSNDDLGIGQVLEKALPYFDFICPMVYPSHFGAGWNGYKNPAEHPYEVIHESMARAVERAKAMGQDPLKLRPWLQDFNMGATYTSDMIKAQIKGTYDAGLTSWLMWSAANTYTRGALAEE